MNAGNNRAKMAAALAMGLAALLTALAGAAPAAAQISFVESAPTPLTFPNGGGVIGVATGDFNGDGILDLAVTQQTFGSGGGSFVSIMLGNGDGSFGPPVNLPLPATGIGRTILAKDVDNDGNLDLLVDISEPHEVLFFKGRGDGTFNDPVAINVGGPSVALQAADLNGDGNLDLVTLNNDTTATVLLGNGDGTFQAPAIYRIACSQPSDLALADLDGQNGPDIVIGCFNSLSIEVLLNIGNGTFGLPSNSFPARTQVTGVFAADFDGDGKLDVVVTGLAGAPGNLGFLKGNGDGTFQAPLDQNFQEVENVPFRMFTDNVVLDVNGDGIPDVLITHNSGGQTNYVTVGLGRGDGHFDLVEWVAAPLDGNPTFSVVAGDFNGDGILDLAVASQNTGGLSPGGVSIALGTGGGNYLAPRAFSLTTVAAQHGFFVLGDFNNDVQTDVIAMTTHTLNLLPGRGDGTLGPPVVVVDLPSNGINPPIRTADIDQDGNLDVVFATTFPLGPSGLLVGLGNGNGTFNFRGFSARSDFSGFFPANVILGDFNGDGKLDLAVMRNNYGANGGAFLEVYLYPFNTHVEIIDGVPRDVLDVSYSFMVSPGGFGGRGADMAMVAADFDNDGKLDIVLHSLADDGGPERLLFFKGNGDGTFQTPTRASLNLSAITDFKAADLNGDGKMDLAAATGTGPGAGAYVLLGNGDGTFQPPTFHGVGGGPNGAVAIADLNGDGIPDLVVEGQTAGLAVFPGNGDGTFGLILRFAIGSMQEDESIGVADLNGDGKPDVVAGRLFSGQDLDFLTVLINSSSGPGMAPLKKR